MTLGCQICGGILSHEKWCVSNAVLTPPIGQLTEEDEIRLKALGVTWNEDVQLVDKEKI